jgi:hypothetical protein
MKAPQNLLGICMAMLLLSTTAGAQQPTQALDSEVPVDLNGGLNFGLNFGFSQEAAVKTTQAESSATDLGINTRTIHAKVGVLRTELARFADSAAPDSKTYLTGALSLTSQSGGAWDYALGARFDVQAQTGAADYSRAKLDYTENYLRWRSPQMRLTVGTQNVLWGRVDEIPPIDRLSRVDLSRGVLDRLSDRRRAVPAVRLESFQGGFKIDAVWLPVFDPAVLPDAASVWHPVDVVNQRILGIGTLQTGGLPITLDAADGSGGGNAGSGGAGIRLTQTGGSFDVGFSLQRVKQSTPYYKAEFNLTHGLPARIKLTGVHPYSWVIGAELETQIGNATFRLEAAHSRDQPVTEANTFAYRTKPASDVVAGVEFFPGDGETRITLQLAGQTKDAVHVLDRTEFYSLNGELERHFAQGRWRGNLRFFNGLNERDNYHNAQLTYLGIDQHAFYLAAHLFSGNAQALGGYYQNNDMISVGWQAKF